MTSALPHYPRTLHLGGSGGGKSKHAAPWSAVASAHLVVEEKVDGSHAGLCFDEDANLMLFHRKTILASPPLEAEFQLLHKQAQLGMDALWETLQTRYVLYGEWARWTHSVFYDALPRFFLEDDIYDRERGAFLSTPARATLRETLPEDFSFSVEVLGEGVFESEAEVQAFIGPSRYKSIDWIETLRATESDRADQLAESDLAEGLYIKHEEDGVVKGRYKWVREDFIESIKELGTHWRSLQPLKNSLR